MKISASVTFSNGVTTANSSPPIRNTNVGQLSDIANIAMGQSPAGETYNENGNGMIFYQGCTDFGTRFPVPRVYTTAPTRFAKSGDILMSVRAPVGTLNVAIEDCRFSSFRRFEERVRLGFYNTLFE